MVATHPIPAGEYVPTADQRVVMYSVPWEHYEAIAAFRGEKSVPRLAYLEGVLELMSPSVNHERIASYLANLIVTFALERSIELSSYRSWTLKRAPDQAGVEPDECFIFGDQQDKPVPDLAIEVIWTSGGIEKLEIYRRLGVREVWFWEEGQISVHVLGTGGYAPQARSTWLPDLDLTLVCSLLELPTVTQAIRALRDALR